MVIQDQEYKVMTKNGKYYIFSRLPGYFMGKHIATDWKMVVDSTIRLATERAYKTNEFGTKSEAESVIMNIITRNKIKQTNEDSKKANNGFTDV